MATRTNNNKTYYINPAYLTFVEDSGYGANLIQVSASSSCWISVYDPSNGISYSDADKNYQRWKVTAYNNKFPDNQAYRIYARLEIGGTSALIIYSTNTYPVSDGSYYYILIGNVSATDGSSIREITYDTGYLESVQGSVDANDLNDMWELDKYSSPWLIKAKQWLHSFTVKGFVTLIGGWVFKKEGEEKVVSDIKRSTDSDEDVPVSDENLATSKYVESVLEGLDDRYLSKVKDDETPFSIGIGQNLSVGHDVSVGGKIQSKDFAEGTVKGGYAVRTNTEGEYEAETDNIVARILAKTYDLLVQNHATFVGNLSSEEFVSGFLSGKGWAIRMKEWLNATGVKEKKSVAEFDELIVRGSMRVYEFIVSQLLGENDNRIFTGMMEVDHYDASDGKVYLKTDNGKLYNPFRVDDIIIVQQYGGVPAEESNYYVTKQYEFIVTEVGVGDLSDGEERLDWVRFRNFTTSIEGGDESLIAERDTLVRIDNLSDANRKGIIQLMSVGEDTPYMDFIYGAKTDPENSLKGRLGNLGGVYNPLFGWLKEFGAYLTNLYAVGEFVIAHTGEDVSDTISIAKGQFRTNYRQTTYDMSEEQNFFTNASMTNNCEHWTLGEDVTEYFLVDDLPQFFNYELYSTEETYASLAEWKGRDMLRIAASSVHQANSLIAKPGTHKVYGTPTMNEDGTFTENYEEVADTLYLSVRLYMAATGGVEMGFVDGEGNFIVNDFYYSKELEAQEDGYEIKLSGTWDGTGDFCIKCSGDTYIDLLSLTDKPLDNFKITTQTAIEQDATRIALLGTKINGVEGSVTNLGIELNAMEERITLYVDKEVEGVNSSVAALEVSVGKISSSVATAQGSADNAQKAADAAQSAADAAAANALAAQSAADAAQDTADANATAISQTDKSISAMAGAFTIDSSGNYILTKAAGAVITADAATLYATKAGIIAAINVSPESVTISASRVDLSGLVTTSALNATLGNYATDSELAAAKNELNTAVTNLNATLTTKIDAKATTDSVNSLTQKVNDLNTTLTTDYAKTGDLGKLAYQNAVNTALCDSTLIYNGFIRTSLIDVDNLYVKHFSSTSNDGMLTIEGSEIMMYSTDGATEYFSLVAGSGGTTMTLGASEAEGYFASLTKSRIDMMYNGGIGCTVASTGVTVYNSTTDTYGCILTGTGLTIANGSYISGLAVGNISTLISTTTDFLLANSAFTLPAASSCKGKVLFVKLNGGYKVSSSSPVYAGNSATAWSVSDSVYSKTYDAGRSVIFVNNGASWYEFICYQ